jgi:hypothetical protein
MCIALSMKQGKTPKTYSPEAAKVSEEMTEEQLIEFCKEPVKGKEQTRH